MRHHRALRVHQKDLHQPALTSLVLHHIAEQGHAYLKPNGWLLMEHGWQQAQAVITLLREFGYKNVNIWRDYGNVERITGGQKVK